VLKVRACFSKTDDKVFDVWATKNKSDFETVLDKIPRLLEEENSRYDPDRHQESLKGPVIAKTNLPKKVAKELVRRGKYTREELEYAEEDDDQTCWNSAKKMFSRRSATRDNNASNSSTKNALKAIKLRSKVQARRFSQHLRDLSTCFERLSKKGFTFGRELTDLT